jgi:thiol-disulfide isomerase/thioredoxin
LLSSVRKFQICLVRIQELADGRWERPNKDLQPFELTDLSGASWGLKRLEGKTLLINVWATWCGPCQAELPHFQKLYEKLKSRNDVTVFTLNVDEELGKVEPFLKEKGYTFPVLPAYAYVNQLIESLGIPQNWVVGKNGKWEWQQLGFDAFESNWEATMEAKIDSVTRGN